MVLRPAIASQATLRDFFEIEIKNLVPVSPEFKFNCPDPLLLHLLKTTLCLHVLTK